MSFKSDRGYHNRDNAHVNPKYLIYEPFICFFVIIIQWFSIIWNWFSGMIIYNLSLKKKSKVIHDVGECVSILKVIWPSRGTINE